MKMKEIIFAGQNPGKFREFEALMPKDKWVLKFVFPQDAHTGPIRVEEFGKTLRENAYIKAKHYYDLFQTPSLSDDSGLFIPDLPGEMGVESAYFGGKELNDSQRCEALLERLQTLRKDSASQIQAYFECCLCYYVSPREIYFFSGNMRGTIAQSKTGEEGFGYDPIFIPLPAINPEGKTLAALGTPWKNIHSHRYLAIKSFLQFEGSSS